MGGHKGSIRLTFQALLIENTQIEEIMFPQPWQVFRSTNLGGSLRGPT
jgi:hypothetical protein